MEFTSKGLGRRCLRMTCGEERIAISTDLVQLHGTVKPPLSWQYTISMDARDWTDFFRTAFHPVVILYLLRPKRWGLLLQAGAYLGLFFAKYSAALLLQPVRKELPALAAQPGAPPADPAATKG